MTSPLHAFPFVLYSSKRGCTDLVANEVLCCNHKQMSMYAVGMRDEMRGEREARGGSTGRRGRGVRGEAEAAER